MTDREALDRVDALLALADRCRLPGHRHTADRALEDLDELRAGLRALRGAFRPTEAARYPRRPVCAAGVTTGRTRDDVLVEVRRRRA